MNAMENIEWRPVDGYDELYEVSNDGRVRRIPRSPAHKETRRELKPWFNDAGYPCVSLWRDGVDRKFRVHRLVAIAFIPNPEGHAVVCHNDGDSTNAAASNLRWDTQTENLRDTVRHGTHRNQFRDRDECANGHPFNDENTLYTKEGRRCRVCRRLRVQAWRARKSGVSA